MTHHILVSVDVPPETDFEKLHKWKAFEQRLGPIEKTTKGIVRLGAGVWLIPRDSGMIFAAECIAAARSCSLNPKARFVSEDA